MYVHRYTLHVYICIDLCVYVYMPYECIHLGRYIGRHESVCACIFYIQVYMQVDIHMYMHTDIIYMPTYTWLYAYAWAYIKCMYVHKYTF